MIDEQLTFGIDLGIGSCGWAVLREPSVVGAPGAIEGLGAWCFDVPETDKDRVPTNQIRRSHRLLRRVIRRRRGRMTEIRRLFHAHDLLPSAESDALKLPGLDPWGIRAQGLERPLTPIEFAVALRPYRQAARIQIRGQAQSREHERRGHENAGRLGGDARKVGAISHLGRDVRA